MFQLSPFLEPESLEYFRCISLSSLFDPSLLISKGICFVFDGDPTCLIVDLSLLSFVPSFWHTVPKCFVNTHGILGGRGGLAL